ncbi:TetR/AcrR family transcriptional regulator [Streptomyces silaceus]|uniref:TetR/AcrR family transcriptional regulator n=1 Tax=Streptomyces silaceus TaxID=545123 RepID=UPI0006EBDF7C|nr:TetR/AcrR family transcriptional regulator [Streptomyces silaceus]
MTRTAGRRYAAADARRAAIVEAALARFAQAGYLNASLARIAADAGTSAPVVVHHFGSKEGLLTAVLQAREERTAETFEPLREAARGDDVRALFRALLELAAYNLTQPGLIELYTRLSAEAGAPGHPAHAYFAERYERVVTLLADALTGARDAGHLHADTDPPAVAREILAVSDGLQVQWAFAAGRLDFVGLYRAHLDRLARALTVDGTGLAGPTA